MPRRLFWVLLFAVSPLVPLSAQALRVPYDSFTLANGLQVLVAPDHAVPVVTVNIWYHVGSGDEKPGRTGFAHLFEHIMFMGSEHVPTGEFDKLLEAAGGEERPLATPPATPIPNANAVPTVTTGSSVTGNATTAAAAPAINGAAGFWIASTKRSRRRTNSRVITKPPINAAALTASQSIVVLPEGRALYATCVSVVSGANQSPGC